MFVLEFMVKTDRTDPHPASDISGREWRPIRPEKENKMPKSKTQYSVQLGKREPLVQETGWIERHPSERGRRTDNAPLGKPSIHAIIRLLEYGRK
jgi:hypothetical protein